MTLIATLGEYGAQQLGISGKKGVLQGLDIWNVEVVLSSGNHQVAYWSTLVRHPSRQKPDFI